ncbi:hypothetical protein ACFV6E_32725 [Streptomyces sp. NPDC059785]|uniref:hypothetical protein n=1 Tax=Streptomyces sp. NPDC059785 TaxID=3346945 RepID=UPI00365D2E25
MHSRVAACNAAVTVLGPRAAEEHLGRARSWSVIVAAQTLGATTGAGPAVRVQADRPIRIAVLATYPAARPSLFQGVAALGWLIAAATFCAGSAGGIFTVLWASTLQREVPE